MTGQEGLLYRRTKERPMNAISSEEKGEMQDKDLRWTKQFGDFAECLTMYVLGQLQARFL